jgi:hypothetical protein
MAFSTLTCPPREAEFETQGPRREGGKLYRRVQANGFMVLACQCLSFVENMDTQQPLGQPRPARILLAAAFAYATQRLPGDTKGPEAPIKMLWTLGDHGCES